MAVKAAQNTPRVARRSFEINHQPSPTWLENPPNLGGTLASQFRTKVMKHDRGEHGIEMGVRKRQSLSKSLSELDLDACRRRLLPRPRYHLRRGIDSTDDARRSDMSSGRNRKSASSATHIQNFIARFKASQLNLSFTKGSLVAAHKEPDQQVIANGPVQNVTRSF